MLQRPRDLLGPLLVLVPLLASFAYALVYPLFAPVPDLADVVPDEAILVRRFRDRAALDALWYRPATDPVRPSEALAAERNLAGMPGVDPSRPFHFVLLPREGRNDPTLLVLPVGDGAALRARFEDADAYLPRGHVRHALFVEVRGDFAAVGGDRQAVRHLGRGGITGADLGEDALLAFRVPDLVRFAMISASASPWRGIVAALGFTPDTAVEDAAPEGPLDVLLVAGGRHAVVPAGRLLRVADAWRTARLWTWRADARVRAELEPTPGPLADLLARVAASPPPDDPEFPPVPVGAEAWLRMPSAAARAAVATALHDAGVPFPGGSAVPGNAEALADLGRTDGPGSGGLLLWATPGGARPDAWTVGLAAGTGRLPDLARFHPAFPAEAGEASVPEGALPLTLAAPRGGQGAPAARIVRRRVGGWETVVFGEDPDGAWARLEAAAAGAVQGTAHPAPEAGWVRLATFGIRAARAAALAGGELEDGGLLAGLGGGDVVGEVETDGRVLRVEARVVPASGGR